MLLFFQIVLAVLLVAAILVGLGLWFFRRWTRRLAEGHQASTALLDPTLLLPARVRLRRGRADEACEALHETWAGYHQAGFRLLGDFVDQHGGLAHVRLARHPAYRLVLALIADFDDRVDANVFCVTTDKQLHALTTGPGPSVRTRRFNWQVDDALTPTNCLEKLNGLVAGQDLREPDRKLARLAFERAWAAHMDHLIAQGPPDLKAINKSAGDIQPRPTEAQLDQALLLGRSYWSEQLDQAVLDNWRRKSRIDAVAWEELADDLHIVHGGLNSDDIMNMLAEDDFGERLVKQFVTQGLAGVELYQQVVLRLPQARQRTCLGEVSQPVKARIYGPGFADEHEVDHAEGRSYLYEATDPDGRASRGVIVANSSTDARRQLDAMGFVHTRIVLEPTPGTQTDGGEIDPGLAALAVRAALEPASMALLRSLLANAWIWGPPAVLTIWSLLAGRPFDWMDYLIWTYAGLASGAMLLLVLPMLLYNALLKSKLHGRWKPALVWLSVLKRVNLFGAISAAQLLAERCKILAADGRVDEALALWNQQEPRLPADQYFAELSQIQDAAGDLEGMIASQRQVLATSSAPEMPTVDLALSLARYQRAVDEAEDLLAQVSIEGLSELTLAGHHYARGLILAERGQHQAALNHYAHAIEQADIYRGNPAIAGLLAEINGYAALTLKSMGQSDQADSLWRSITPVLAFSASSRGLIDRYESA